MTIGFWTISVKITSLSSKHCPIFALIFFPNFLDTFHVIGASIQSKINVISGHCKINRLIASAMVPATKRNYIGYHNSSIIFFRRYYLRNCQSLLFVPDPYILE